MTQTPGDQPSPYDPHGGQTTPQPQPYGPPYPPAGYPGQVPYRYAPDHPKATTSLVLGILGMVACAVVAPFAWVTGKRTLEEIDASRGALGGRGAAQAGYVLGIVGTVILALGVLMILGYALLMLVLVGGVFAASP